MPRTEEGLYQALEAELKKSGEPMSCASLYDKPSVRKHAATVNRVSDYLGNMWRKGKVLRLPAPRDDNTRARWMYALKPPTKTQLPSMDQAVDYLDKHMILQRPSLEISEKGDTITFELGNLTVTIRHR